MSAAEQVVLLDDEGRAVGTADKHTVHGATTPRHLGFSCYGFDGAGQVLVTQRALDKPTFPGVWTNTCCGHPAPGEAVEDAARRRLRHELDVRPLDLRLVLPDFAYRASFAGVEEHELCPVLVCRIEDPPRARPDEVEAWQWWSWSRLRDEAAAPGSILSPWARLQIPLLAASGEVELLAGAPSPR
ncbi:isopentenyl-diphosphate Delta-isomerase [Pseudonocardia humida]|uniref:Isopentenyl-diphosphate Delta-isomerase n=1 Tax=Pseudonocardia humida TaxID=2800819 RepID=A0ABT0ZZT4_9PSEU|nr:isopentenyl-diphosphate Delta-isomerase [Pseudonocardia humida]MCO1656266.1 isopentenyl-diphosphate Delta-isomerase [Pseudonocardia humida]